jgi:Dyp-type peroxidase family
MERKEIQGFVVSGYAKMHRAGYVFVRVKKPTAARAWLLDLATRITTSEKSQEHTCLNVALTHEGLRALGVSASDLSTFSAPFQEGMASPYRSRVLGDTDNSSPEHWAWGGPTTAPIHVLLMLFAKDDATFTALEKVELKKLKHDGALEVVHQLSPEPLPGRQSVGKFGVEHFGFADGMSQPVIRGSGQDDKLAGDDARRTVIETGEFVLGYPNGYNKLTPWPTITTPLRDGEAFGRNGSYLVFRQLAQDVAGFWRHLDEQTTSKDPAEAEEERVRLAAKLVGRWPSGAPIVKSPHRDEPDLGADNSFGYAAWDAKAMRCPVASHIRRTNPRDSLGSEPEKALELANLHRIMRRGRVYGPALDNPLDGDDGNERGLFFICLNANIERQFEFIQHSWCNNPKFGGLYDEQDPLLGNQAGSGNFTIQQNPVRKRLFELPTFVTTRGGGYFFLPGIKALQQLGSLTGTTETET